MKLLPEHVGAARALLKISQADLARVAGVSENTIHFYESGKTSTLRDDTLVRIQTALEQRGIEFLNSGSPGVRYNPSKALIPRGE